MQVHSDVEFKGVIKALTPSLDDNSDNVATTEWVRSNSGSRHIGEIFYSLLPIEDAGVHLLDGSVINLTGVYSELDKYIQNIYDKASLRDDIKVVGSPAISDHIVSDFSESNWIEVPQKLNLATADTWEIRTKFTVSNISNSYNNHVLVQSGPTAGGLQMAVTWANTGKLILHISTNGTSWTSEAIDSSVLTIGETYYVKIVFTGTQYIVYKATDANGLDDNSNQVIVINSSDKVFSYDCTYSFGNYDRTTGVLGSSIDLTDTYISVNDDIIWKGTERNMFCSENTWQTYVNKYDACGYFVYDVEAKTLRLPKVTGFMEGTIDENSIGMLVEAGLPNITGDLQISNIGQYTSTSIVGVYNSGIASGALRTGAFHSGENTALSTATASNSRRIYGLALDASESNSVYGNSDTVQPQSIQGFVYIVLANRVVSSVEVDAAKYVNDFEALDAKISTKTTSGEAAHAAMPNTEVIVYSVPSSGTMITAPADGYFTLGGMVSGTNDCMAGLVAYYNDGTKDVPGRSCVGHSTNNSNGLYVTLPCSKGSTLRVWYHGTWAIGEPLRLLFSCANGSV